MNLKGGFEDYKINTAHMPLKLAGFIVFLMIAVGAISFGVSKLIEKPEGYYDIKEYPCDDAPGYGNIMELHYYLTGSSSDIKEQNSRLEEVYSHSLERAYKLMDSVNEYENYINIAYINNHPGENLEVNSELAGILEDAVIKTSERMGFNMFAGPLYAHWNSILILDEEAEFDPIYNSEEEERIRALSRRISTLNKDMLKIEGNKVVFTPDEAFVSYLNDSEESSRIIDLNLLKESYMVELVAEELEKAGFSNGYITTLNGIVHNLSGHSKGEYAFYAVDRLEDAKNGASEKTPAFKMAGVKEVTKGSSLSGFRMFETLKTDLYHVVETESESIFRSPFINVNPNGTYNYYDSLYAISDFGDDVQATYELIKIINDEDVLAEDVIEKENGIHIYLFHKGN